jgi:hypothetical protein
MNSALALVQPPPRTPGLTKELVRLHASERYRNQLQRGNLTSEDWLLAELEVVQQMQATHGRSDGLAW